MARLCSSFRWWAASLTTRGISDVLRHDPTEAAAVEVTVGALGQGATSFAQPCMPRRDACIHMQRQRWTSPYPPTPSIGLRARVLARWGLEIGGCRHFTSLHGSTRTKRPATTELRGRAFIRWFLCSHIPIQACCR